MMIASLRALLIRCRSKGTIEDFIIDFRSLVNRRKALPEDISEINGMGRTTSLWNKVSLKTSSLYRQEISCATKKNTKQCQ